MKKVNRIVVLVLGLSATTWALAPNLIGLEIEGPNEVAEESSAQYKAIAVYDDNSTKDVTNLAEWIISPDDYAGINDSGLLATYELVMPTEDVTIYAQYEVGNDIFQAEKDVQIFALCPQGGALEFDGKDDYVEIENNLSLNLTRELTLAAWVRMAQHKELSTFVQKWGDTSNRRQYLLCETSAKARIYMSHNGAEYRFVNSTTDIPLDEWTHIAGTYDGMKLRMYLNGILEGEVSTTGPIFTSEIYARIGGYGNDPEFPRDRYLNGTIDEVCVFNRALSAEEVADLMYLGVTIDSNLVGYWDFGEGEGQVAYDSSGNGNDGYLGADPCEPDSSDPCWVEPGAPLHCTARQIIVRNISGALDDKAAAAELIYSALEKEKASEKLLLDEMKDQKPRCWGYWDIVQPIVEIKKSMLFEEQCRQKLQAGIEALERALNWLLNDTIPDWPKKADKPPKCNK
jgi:hypothetical protein